MIKRLFFRTWLALAAIMLPANLSAQEIIEAVDSIWVDTDTIDLSDSEKWKKSIPQYEQDGIAAFGMVER